ncbi:MAG: hypothetical protein ACRDQW_02835 [Haloechinothrix sp.]
MTLTTEHRQVPEPASPVPTPPRKTSVRIILGWAAVVAALAAAAVLVLALVTSDGTSPRIDSGPPLAEHSPENLPMSADAAERWTNRNENPAVNDATLDGLPSSPDAAERWVAARLEAERRAQAAYSARLQGQADAYATSRIG